MLFKEAQILLFLLFIFQAIRQVPIALGECPILGDFHAPAVDWSNRTGPKSDGFDKNLPTTAGSLLYSPHIRSIGNRALVLDLVFIKFPDTVLATKLLAHLEIVIMYYDPSILAYMINTCRHFHWKIVQQWTNQAASLFGLNDVLFARNMEDRRNFIKERTLCLRDRFATIYSHTGSNRSPWLKLRYRLARKNEESINNILGILVGLPSVCTKPRTCHSHASYGFPGGNTKQASHPWQHPIRNCPLLMFEEIVNSAAKLFP